MEKKTGLFKKETICQTCGASVSKKEIFEFDSSHQGYYKQMSRKKVCKDCLMNLFFEALKAFREKTVIIYPILEKGFNAYVHYSFDRLIEMTDKRNSETNTKYIKDMKSFLPNDDEKCAGCGDRAYFTWASPEIVRNDPYEFVVNNNYSDHQYLCVECLIKEFKSKIEELGIVIKDIYPPIVGEGFCVSWQL